MEKGLRNSILAAGAVGLAAVGAVSLDHLQDKEEFIPTSGCKYVMELFNPVRANLLLHAKPGAEIDGKPTYVVNRSDGTGGGVKVTWEEQRGEGDALTCIVHFEAPDGSEDSWDIYRDGYGEFYPAIKSALLKEEEQ